MVFLLLVVLFIYFYSLLCVCNDNLSKSVCVAPDLSISSSCHQLVHMGGQLNEQTDLPQNPIISEIQNFIPQDWKAI